MSNEALSWAYQQHTKWGAGCKAVLVALADQADESHSCYPGQQLLAERTDQNERTVRAHLVRLEQLGLIRRECRFLENGNRTSDRFFLAVSPTSGNVLGIGDRRTRKPPESETAGSQRTTTGIGRHSPPESETGEPLEEPSGQPSAKELTAKFDEFWATYPRKTAKATARKRWDAAIKRGTDPDEIIRGAHVYAEANRSTETKYIKQPDGWLLAGRWADETVVGGAGIRAGPKRTADDKARDGLELAQRLAAQQAAHIEHPQIGA